MAFYTNELNYCAPRVISAVYMIDMLLVIFAINGNALYRFFKSNINVKMSN